jgi:hypothetical protein
LERIVLRAMAPEPAARFATARDVAAALDGCLRRPRRLALQAGALFLAALAAAIWSLWPRPLTVSTSSPGRVDAAAGAIPPPRAVLAPRPPAPPPLRIDLFEVTVHPHTPDDPVGPIGINVFAARFDQDARVKVRLNRPAYCFLIALNPDGSNELCSPEDPAVAPSRTATIDFPSDPGTGFGLTDGVGMQAFVLVASRKVMPPFSKWSSAGFDHLPWKSVADAGVWRFDGLNFDCEVERGKFGRLADLPQTLEATCRALQAGPAVETIQAVAFPVRSREKLKVGERRD